MSSWLSLGLGVSVGQVFDVHRRVDDAKVGGGCSRVVSPFSLLAMVWRCAKSSGTEAAG